MNLRNRWVIFALIKSNLVIWSNMLFFAVVFSALKADMEKKQLNRPI